MVRRETSVLFDRRLGHEPRRQASWLNVLFRSIAADVPCNIRVDIDLIEIDGNIPSGEEEIPLSLRHPMLLAAPPHDGRLNARWHCLAPVRHTDIGLRAVTRGVRPVLQTAAT